MNLVVLNIFYFTQKHHLLGLQFVTKHSTLLVTSEPEYFNGQVQEYRSEESYRSASEMYDILYDDLKIEDRIQG